MFSMEDDSGRHMVAEEESTLFVDFRPATAAACRYAPSGVAASSYGDLDISEFSPEGERFNYQHFWSESNWH
jgi:hypothetical protein